MKKENQVSQKDQLIMKAKKLKTISTDNLVLFLNLGMLEMYRKASNKKYSLNTAFKNITLMLLMFLVSVAHAQTSTLKKITNKPSVTVLNIDTKGMNIEPVQMGNMVRLELEKLDSFEVMDRYDVSYVVEKNKLNIANCYGKICLVEVGSMINSEKMFTGSAELIGETIVVTFRLIDVKSSSIEKVQVNEYLNLPKELQAMVKVSISEMFGRPIEKTQVSYLSKKNNFESSTNNPSKSSVNLSGPRSGFTYFTGEAGKILQAPNSEGGFGSYPLMFQFGYQFEVQYLNEGNYQALFEFLPTVSGFNQNVFIPSITIMNGFRDNKHGWELAFGPTFGLVTKANGYYDSEQKWHLQSDWKDSSVNTAPTVSRLDSRGEYELQAGFIIAAGKTFKSGKLNIPVNFYLVPNKDGVRIGASFGFNAKRKKSDL
ncbi:MAG: hypothetical protein WCP52_01545 [Bacteroidota bacterium]